MEEAKTSARAAGRVVLALAKKRELLAGFATARKLSVRDRMRAIELDAKLAGELKGDSVTVIASASASRSAMSEVERAELVAAKRASIERNRARN